jgi:hypothetical protein
MLIALKLLACIILASFGIATMAQNDFAERTSSAVFTFSSIITSIIAIIL